MNCTSATSVFTATTAETAYLLIAGVTLLTSIIGALVSYSLNRRAFTHELRVRYSHEKQMQGLELMMRSLRGLPPFISDAIVLAQSGGLGAAQHTQAAQILTRADLLLRESELQLVHVDADIVEKAEQCYRLQAEAVERMVSFYAGKVLVTDYVTKLHEYLKAVGDASAFVMLRYQAKAHR